ncbi:hypothetical protein TNCV_2846171 [Trichonephila clavipes]|nr:hypothetical protein TNCV_2846171 [Trichonephila clavipes]
MATGSYLTPTYSRSQSEVQGDLHTVTQNPNDASRIFLERSTCVIDDEISLFLHKFPEESRGSRALQKWLPSRQLGH